MLITFKDNHEGTFSFSDLMKEAFKDKSNLLVELGKNSDELSWRVLDPLGNVFCGYVSDFAEMEEILEKRIRQLSSYTRIASRKAVGAATVPPEKDFITALNYSGEIFHRLLYHNNQLVSRYLGNASFRGNGKHYFSRRNVDKRSITIDDFVAVKPGLPVEYFGNSKPSVDTPIQLLLYQYYPQVNYMLHGHAYAREAPFTRRLIPCGALEEAAEIIASVPDKNASNFCVNLNGHGCLLLAKDVSFFKQVDYYARPMPEVQHEF